MSNIRHGAVNIYLGEVDADPDNWAEWDHIGYSEGEQTALKAETKRMKLNGFKRGLGRFYEFLATGLQSGVIDMSLLAQYDNRRISILLSGVNNPEDKLVLKDYQFNFYPEYVFAEDRVKKNVIRATRVTRNIFHSVTIIDPPAGDLVTIEDLAVA